MTRLSLAFFATAALYALGGMGLGMWMGRQEDFTLAPVHAHINLVGWTTLAIMGGFFALAGVRAPQRLGWASYGLIAVGLLLMIPSLSAQMANDKHLLPLLIVSELMFVIAMVLFLAAIVITWLRSGRPGVAGLGAMAPAE